MDCLNKFMMQRSISTIRTRLCLLILLMLCFSGSAYAQFEKPDIKKMTIEERAQFDDINWTGRGLYKNTDLDDMETNKIRARLQAVYGDPTKTLEDLIHKANFRPGKAIQFEYWFTVNDSIPMMVLDVDGPFRSGLVYGGASKYIDLMPQIKRTFAKEILGADNPEDYQDYFYSPEREQWFNVTYKDGKYKTKKISSPDGMKISYNN